LWEVTGTNIDLTSRYIVDLSCSVKISGSEDFLYLRSVDLTNRESSTGQRWRLADKKAPQPGGRLWGNGFLGFLKEVEHEENMFFLAIGYQYSRL